VKEEDFSSYYFIVEIDGIKTDRFFSCEGLEVETNVYEIEEGGLNTTIHKHIGQSRYPNLILKKGITKNNELSNWFHSNQNNSKLERKTMPVIYMHPSGIEIKRWDFFNAFPCKWKVQMLETKDGGFPIEIIEIAHD